ncbi:hypothetical protein TYRP_018303, partial [Tyrophagus putrescentiae]
FDSPNTINDVRAFMDALILLLPMLLIWALFEQMASQWTLQSTAMQNTQSGSSFTFEDSDQTQMVINLLTPSTC